MSARREAELFPELAAYLAAVDHLLMVLAGEADDKEEAVRTLAAARREYRKMTALGG